MGYQKAEAVTDEMWMQVSEFNRNMVSDYLMNQTHLSDKTLISYESGIRGYFDWVRTNLNNKDCTEIKKKEFKRYLNWLTNRGLSDSAIRFKKSVVSAFNKFIEVYYEDEYPMFRNYVTSEMQVVQTGYVHEKVPLTPEEYLKLCEELEKREEWEKLAYLMFHIAQGADVVKSFNC